MTGELLVKRDDLTGLALGGNKARKLALLAQAPEHHARIRTPEERVGACRYANHSAIEAVLKK